MKLHLIYTDNEVILSSKPYSSWREIQDEFPTYKASLGPWDGTEAIDYLNNEYSNIYPDAKIQVNELISSNDLSRIITFNKHPSA